MSDIIALVDDEQGILDIQKEALSTTKAQIVTFTDPRVAWEYLSQNNVSLVVTDWNMPGMTGMDLLFKIRGLERPPYCILLTAFGTVERAVHALNEGAFHFLEKPFKIDHYLKVIQDALSRAQTARTTLAPPPEARQTSAKGRQSPIYGSAAMTRVLDLAKSAAGKDVSVLLLGQSGTGKEVLADFIHQNSRRSSGPLIKVNCAALPEHLMESELFGHEKGSFTGADRKVVGRFEQAAGGTLFLDEIGDLQPNLQVKLLRALQEKTIERIGAGASVKVDFRLVCATNQNLKQQVADGTFREDLYYRINVVPIKVPPLRERPEDVEPLARHFLQTIGRDMSNAPQNFSADALTALRTFAWPGNIRQLRNAIEYALVMCRTQTISPADLPEEVRGFASGERRAVPPPTPADATESQPEAAAKSPDGLRSSIKETEAEIIRAALEKHNWHVQNVAKDLQISRSTLYERMKALGISRPK